MKRGGKSFQDRELAGDVRTKALLAIRDVIDNDEAAHASWSEYKKNLLMKLATNLLPRLTEITGADGEPLPILGGLSGK